MSIHSLNMDCRRARVLELHSTNKTLREIASLLQVSLTTVYKDLTWLRQKADDDIKNHMSSLAHQYAKTCTGLDVIIKHAFNDAEQATNSRDKIASLTLARDTIKIRYDLQTDSSILEEAMSYVEVTNRQVKHSDNSLSEIIEEQPTNQQLPNESVSIINDRDCEVTSHLVGKQDTPESEHSVFKQPTNQPLPADKMSAPYEEQANNTMRSRMSSFQEPLSTQQEEPEQPQTDSSATGNQTEPSEDLIIAEAAAEDNEDSAGTRANESSSTAPRVQVKRFNKAEVKEEPLDLTTSMSQAQQNELDTEDRRIYKSLSDNMRDSTYNPAKRRYLV